MRTNYCGEINESFMQQTVTVCGWVHYRRDLGGLIFLEIRDRSGLVQIVFSPQEQSADLFKAAEELRKEYVVKIAGVVRQRPVGTENTQLATGQVEISPTQLEILNRAENLPFYPDEHQTISEEIRLKYRYLDLRRVDVLQRFKIRTQAIQVMRRYFRETGFLDIETPILTKATPEGARDYLVPSRVYPGSFFALPRPTIV